MYVILFFLVKHKPKISNIIEYYTTYYCYIEKYVCNLNNCSILVK